MYPEMHSTKTFVEERKKFYKVLAFLQVDYCLKAYNTHLKFALPIYVKKFKYNILFGSLNFYYDVCCVDLLS